MNAPLVESYLPQLAPATPTAPSSREASCPDREEASFDQCLKSASEKPPEADAKAENSEEADIEKTEGKTEDKQSEETDPSRGEGEDEGDSKKNSTTLAATEPLMAIFAEPEAVEVDVETEVSDTKQVSMPAELVDVEVEVGQTAPDDAAEAVPAKETEATTQEFIPQAQTSQPAETAPQPTANLRTARQPEITPAAEGLPSPEAEKPADDELKQVEMLTEEADVVKREPAAPLTQAAPAPEHSGPDQQNGVTLNAGEQMRVEVRQGNGVGRVEATAAAGGDLPVEGSQVIGQVVRGATMMISEGRTKVRVQLRPPELGAVRVELSSDQSNLVEARIVAERDEVRQLIERNLPQLRDSLAASGVEVGQFDVQTQDSGGTPFDEPAGSESNRFAWDGAEPEDEALVSASSARARGVNRSTSAGAVDYII